MNSKKRMDRPVKYHIDDAVLMWVYGAVEAEKYFDYLEAEVERLQEENIELINGYGVDDRVAYQRRHRKWAIREARNWLWGYRRTVNYWRNIAEMNIVRADKAEADRDHWRRCSDDKSDEIANLIAELGMRNETIALADGHIKRLKTRIEELEKHLGMLLEVIKHETNLPSSAANGVTYQGLDEGIVRTDEILRDAKQALEHKEGE